MSKYSPEDLIELRKSPYVENVTENSIIYGPVFEHEYYRLTQLGLEAPEVFRILGLDPDIVGRNTIYAFKHRMKDYQPDDSLTNESGSIAQTLIDLHKENARLKFEVEFLKKKKLIDMGISPETNKSDSTTS